MSDVRIIEKIAPGKTLITDARFITPEQLREEAAHARHADRLRKERGERQSANWHAWHAGREESA